MPALTVWQFDSPYGADAAELRVKRLQEHGGVVVHDLATVVWMPDEKNPRVRQLRHLRGSNALGGAFWGTLIGSVVLMPVAGAAVGAAVGRLRETGISDRFIAELREQLRPGTSALFLLTTQADPEQVRAIFPFEEARLIHADLDPDAAERLRALLEGGEDASD
jgi:uncharacterized membrane protein